VSELVEIALPLMLSSERRDAIPIFQSFISGGSLVDIADRDAPLSSDGNALVLAVDTNILNDRFRETLISAATAKFFKRYAAAISTAYAPLGM